MIPIVSTTQIPPAGPIASTSPEVLTAAEFAQVSLNSGNQALMSQIMEMMGAMRALHEQMAEDRLQDKSLISSLKERLEASEEAHKCDNASHRSEIQALEQRFDVALKQEKNARVLADEKIASLTAKLETLQSSHESLASSYSEHGHSVACDSGESGRPRRAHPAVYW